MRQIKVIGSPGGGNLFKLPGFKQFAQMQKMRGMNMGDMMSQFGLDGGASAAAPGLPGLPPGMAPDQIQDMLPGLPKGYLPPGTQVLLVTQGVREPRRVRKRLEKEQTSTRQLTQTAKEMNENSHDATNDQQSCVYHEQRVACATCAMCDAFLCLDCIHRTADGLSLCAGCDTSAEARSNPSFEAPSF